MTNLEIFHFGLFMLIVGACLVLMFVIRMRVGDFLDLAQENQELKKQIAFLVTLSSELATALKAVAPDHPLLLSLNEEENELSD